MVILLFVFILPSVVVVDGREGRPCLGDFMIIFFLATDPNRHIGEARQHFYIPNHPTHHPTAYLAWHFTTHRSFSSSDPSFKFACMLGLFTVFIPLPTSLYLWFVHSLYPTANFTLCLIRWQSVCLSQLHLILDLITVWMPLSTSVNLRFDNSLYASLNVTFWYSCLLLFF